MRSRALGELHKLVLQAETCVHDVGNNSLPLGPLSALARELRLACGTQISPSSTPACGVALIDSHRPAWSRSDSALAVEQRISSHFEASTSAAGMHGATSALIPHAARVAAVTNMSPGHTHSPSHQHQHQSIHYHQLPPTGPHMSNPWVINSSTRVLQTLDAPARSGAHVRSHSTESSGTRVRSYSTESSIVQAVDSAQQLGPVQAQLASVANLEQLNAALDQHLHIMDARCLTVCLDFLVHNISTYRSDPMLLVVAGKIGAVIKRELHNVSSSQLVDLLHSFGMLRINPGGDEEGFKAIQSHLSQEVIPVFVSQQMYTELVKLLWALSAISCHGELYVDQRIFADSEATLRTYLNSMPLSLLSKITTAYTTCSEAQYAFLDQIHLVLLSRLELPIQFDAAAVSNIMKAMSSTRHPLSSGLLMQHIARRVVNKDPSIKIHHVVVLAKAMAVLRFGEVDETGGHFDPQQFWHTVSLYTASNKHRLTPQMIQDLSYTFALRKIEDTQMFSILAARAMAQLPMFKPMNLSITLWSFARQSRQSDTEFYKMACMYIKQNIERFSIQNISNSLWALSCLEHKDPELYSTVAAHLKQLFQDPDARCGVVVDPTTGVERYVVPGKCSLVERFHTNGKTWQRIHYLSGNVVERPLGEGIPKQQFNAQNLTDLLWAFAKAGHEDSELFALMIDRCIHNIGAFTITSVVDCCWALSKFGLAHHGFFKAMENHMHGGHSFDLVMRMGLDYLSDVLYAMAELNYQPSQEFLEAAMDQAQGKWDRPNCSESSTVRLVYAFHMLGVLKTLPDHPFVARIEDYISLALADGEQQQQMHDEQQQGKAAAGGGDVAGA